MFLIYCTLFSSKKKYIHTHYPILLKNLQESKFWNDHHSWQHLNELKIKYEKLSERNIKLVYVVTSGKLLWTFCRHQYWRGTGVGRNPVLWICLLIRDGIQDEKNICNIRGGEESLNVLYLWWSLEITFVYISSLNYILLFSPHSSSFISSFCTFYSIFFSF